MGKDFAVIGNHGAMVFGIGVDIIEIERIQKQIAEHEDRFVGMVFTSGEISYCLRMKSAKGQARCFAGRFAVKEAALKALGIGLRNGMQWKDIEVMNDALGKPALVFHHHARKSLENHRITSSHVTLSHNQNTAVAVVILENES